MSTTACCSVVGAAANGGNTNSVKPTRKVRQQNSTAMRNTAGFIPQNLRAPRICRVSRPSCVPLRSRQPQRQSASASARLAAEVVAGDRGLQQRDKRGVLGVGYVDGAH